MNNTTNDHLSIVLQERPLIDLRAPVEYAKGSFPNTVNIPLMSDDERHQVGTTYKKEGHDAAVLLGHALVSGKTKEKRVKNWVDHIKAHPNALLFCYRGGMRSQISQQWIKDAANLDVARLEGGYKALRQFLIQSMEPENLQFDPLILTGNTGSAKTVLLQQIANAIDLEGLANHRGSSFGGNATEQPSQITFENRLAYALIQQQNHRYSHLLFEDESRNIGRSYLPKNLYGYIKAGKYVLVEVDLETRIHNIHQDYVHALQEQYQTLSGKDSGLLQWKEIMESNIHRIQKRLGAENHQQILTFFQEGCRRQTMDNDFSYHKHWIQMLLEKYYDPMYEYQIQKKQDKILFRGSYKDVLSFLKEKSTIKK